MLSNYSRSSFKLFGIIIAIIFLSISSSNAFGQNEQKSVKKLFCMVDKDHYFIKGTDRGEFVISYDKNRVVRIIMSGPRHK